MGNENKEKIIKDGLYFYLLDKFSFIQKQDFDKYYKGIKLGYLLAMLGDNLKFNYYI